MQYCRSKLRACLPGSSKTAVRSIKTATPADTAVADTAVADTAVADTAAADTAVAGTAWQARLWQARLCTKGGLSDVVATFVPAQYVACCALEGLGFRL